MEKPRIFDRQPRPRPWPLRLSVLGAALLSFLVFAPMAWHVDNTFDTYRDFLAGHQGTENLRDDIHHLNLQIVTEAEELVACGDGHPDSLRTSLLHQLDTTMGRIRREASPCMVQAHFAQADSARQVLRRLENQALVLSGAGAIPQAQDILQGPSYWKALGLFTAELDSVMAHCSNNWSQVLAREGRREIGALAGALGILALSLGTWLALLKKVENREHKLRQEVAEHRQTGAELSVAVGRCEKLFHEAYDSIFLIDPDRGTILDANRQAAARLGHTPEELIGRSFADFDVGLAEDRNDPDRLAGMLKTCTGHLEERHHRRRDGTLLTMEMSSHLVQEDGGRSILQCLCRDVTERNRLEQELCQAQKMECVGRAASGIVHDFSNLLIAIQGHTTMADRVLDNDHPAARHLRRIQLASTQAMDVSRSLLTFASNRSQARDHVDLNQIVSGAMRLLGPSLTEDISLEVRLHQDGPLWVKADGALLQQAVLNLGLNAREAVASGGSIKVELSHRQDTAVIEVRDSGPGIPPELLDRIWEPFFTTRTGGQGSGLGLFNVKTALDACQGSLQASAPPEGGTVFRLEIPLTPPPGLPAGSDGSQAEPRGEGLRILLADPHGFAREVTAETLRLRGCDVTAAATAAELLEYLQGGGLDQPGHEVHLIILDLSLTGSGGRRCLQELRRRDPDLPVILMRGGSQSAPGEGEDPAAVILEKPFELKELCRLALNLARREQAQERPAP